MQIYRKGEKQRRGKERQNIEKKKKKMTFV